MNRASCIIPYYNGGDTIARAIDSVIHSSYCAEVIVVVDGSPQALDPNLTVHQHEQIDAGKLRVIELTSNHGQACARNIGVALSFGDYLSFLDQDDIYLPDFYEQAIPFLEKNPKMAALEVGAEFFQNGLNVLDDPDPRYSAAIWSVPWNVVIRRNIFWACGAFPVGAELRTKIAGEDIAFKNALNRLFPVAVSPRKLIRHHIREGSAGDRYLKRTEVVNGKIIFKTSYANEKDGSINDAMELHINKSLKAFKAERAVEPKISIEKG
jgi:glycosyltransferase involved in cell wall biosynthesis